MFHFLRSNFRWIAGGFLLTYCSALGQTFFIAASVGEWRQTFGLSHGEFGRLYMFATLASAACLPFLGRIVDVVPERRCIALTMPVLAAAALLAAYAPNVAMLAVALFLLRLFGQGMMTHIALTATGRWFSLQRGRAVSLVVLGHQGSEATLPLVFASLALAYGYGAGWVAAAAALLCIGLPLALWAYKVPRTPRPQEADALARLPSTRQWTRAEVVRDPLFWILLTGVLAPPFIGTTVFYHQDYLGQAGGWPPRLFAMSLSVLAVTTVSCALLCGWMVDRYTARRVLPFFLLPLAGACFTFGLSGSPEWLFPAMILLGISYGFSTTLFGALWPEIYGAANLGAIRSVIVSAIVFATAAGPGLTGTLIDQGIPLSRQMTALGVYCFLVVGVMALVSRRLASRALVDAHPGL